MLLILLILGWEHTSSNIIKFELPGVCAICSLCVHNICLLTCSGVHDCRTPPCPISGSDTNSAVVACITGAGRSRKGVFSPRSVAKCQVGTKNFNSVCIRTVEAIWWTPGDNIATILYVDVQTLDLWVTFKKQNKTKNTAVTFSLYYRWLQISSRSALIPIHGIRVEPLTLPN